MEPEPSRGGVGAFAGVCDGSDRVQQPSADDQEEHQRPAVGPELWQPTQRGPTHQQIEHGVEGTGCLQPEDAEQQADDPGSPDHAQQQDAGASLQQHQCQGRVGGCDEYEDVGMVHAAQNCDGGIAPGAPMIDGAGSEQHDRAEQEHRTTHPACGVVGEHDQTDAGDDGHGRPRCMDPATHQGLAGGRRVEHWVWHGVAHLVLLPWLRAVSIRVDGHAPGHSGYATVTYAGVATGGGCVRAANR